VNPYATRTRREKVERASEVYMMLKDLFEERSILDAELIGDPVIGPIIREGGSIEIGIFTIAGRLYQPERCSDWEKRNLPRSSTDRIVKITVTRS